VDERARVLVVDDEESLRHMLSLALSRDGFNVWTASSGEAGLDTLKAGGPFDICVTDIRMPGMDGLAFIDDAMRLGERAPTFIAMSAYGDKQLALEALRRGAFDYISKPFEPSELSLKLRLVVERNRLADSTPNTAEPGPAGAHKPPGRLDQIVSSSPAMENIARTVRKVANFPTTRRANKPFIAVNCGAIPGNLLESELFGHVRGAFTDASADRTGLFEAAHGGTLLLDEIGELPVPLQVKLLRVLVEGEIRPLGASRTTKIDVRVIAATSRDLEEQIKSGTFREDLYHRLNVISIRLPPLRERPEEIPDFVKYFCKLFRKRLGIPEPTVSADALERLEGYSWPGNVRELENALERAIVLADHQGAITSGDLDERFDPGERSSPIGAHIDGDADLALKTRLQTLERELILQALARTSGNRSKAAVLLGISHRALLYKLKTYDIS
jgi:two-component system response regulator AtoC